MTTSVTLMAWFFATTAVAQQGSPADAMAIAAAITAVAKPAYLGNKQCRRCHRSPLEDDVRDFITYQESHPFLRSDTGQRDDTELIFHGKDKHADAFALLMEERGAAMTDRLKMTDTSKYERGSRQHVKELVNNAQGCLTCHADWRADRELSPAFKKMVEKGVACEACHGPSSLWEDPHKRIEWRAKTSAAKEALGMIDVRNPITRARQCFSCHIGNAEQGKVVTHEWYAVGHPQLPGIELETFVREMPPHWRNLAEKGEFEIKRDYLDATSLADDSSQGMPRTQSVMLDSVVALRESLALFAGTAKQATMNQKGATYEWPELGIFDCQSCHHDLQTNSWRQHRGFAGSPPGRVYPPEWPTALVRLGIRHLIPNDDRYQKVIGNFQQRLLNVRKNFDKQPYGDPAQLADPQGDLHALIKALDKFAKLLVKKSVSRRDAGQALKYLANLDSADYADFHSARQIAWAIVVIESELRSRYPQFPAAEKQRARLTDPDEETDREKVERGERDINIFLKFKARQEAAQRQTLLKSEKVFKGLRLNLPAGHGTSPENSIELEYPQVLKRISEYDPATFRQQLRAYAESIDAR